MCGGKRDEFCGRRLEHYRANSPGSSTTDLLERIVREQAFTVLNRLAALRMAEAREFLTE